MDVVASRVATDIGDGSGGDSNAIKEGDVLYWNKLSRPMTENQDRVSLNSNILSPNRKRLKCVR